MRSTSLFPLTKPHGSLHCWILTAVIARQRAYTFGKETCMPKIMVFVVWGVCVRSSSHQVIDRQSPMFKISQIEQAAGHALTSPSTDGKHALSTAKSSEELRPKGNSL